MKSPYSQSAWEMCSSPLTIILALSPHPFTFGTPELNSVVQMRSQESRGGDFSFFNPLAPLLFNAAQNMICFLDCKYSLLSHACLVNLQDLWVFLLRAAFSPFSTQPLLVLGIALTHVQNLTLHLVDLHEVCSLQHADYNTLCCLQTWWSCTWFCWWC